VREEPPLRIPEEFFAGEPADTLHVGALDLTAVDAGVQRVAHVVEDVRSQDALHPGVPVDLDLGHRRAKREVVEGLPPPRALVIVNTGRPVEARRRHRGLLDVRALGQLVVDGQRPTVGHEGATVPLHIVERRFEEVRRDGSQPVAEREARVAHRRAVEVGPRARRRRRRVGNLVRRRLHHPHLVAGEPELAHRDTQDLGVEPLAHLGSAVVHLEGAVAVEMQQRARLVEEGRSEGDAKLHRRDGDAALDARALSIEAVDLRAAGDEVR
jgi:hypothetical protein